MSFCLQWVCPVTKNGNALLKTSIFLIFVCSWEIFDALLSEWPELLTTWHEIWPWPSRRPLPKGQSSRTAQQFRYCCVSSLEIQYVNVKKSPHHICFSILPYVWHHWHIVPYTCLCGKLWSQISVRSNLKNICHHFLWKPLFLKPTPVLYMCIYTCISVTIHIVQVLTIRHSSHWRWKQPVIKVQ